MSQSSLRLLYGELSKGRLDRYLDAHPELVNADTARAVSEEFQHAVEYGDLPAAVATVSTAAEILVRIGEPQYAIALQLQLFDLQLNTAGTAQDYAALRLWALTAGVRAQDARWRVGQAECLLVAAECAHRMSTAHRADVDKDQLVTALRDLADVADLIAEQPPDPKWKDSIARFAHLLGICSEAVYQTQWQEHDLLGLRALLRRSAQHAERIVPKGFGKDFYADPREESAANARLTRIFHEFAN